MNEEDLHELREIAEMQGHIKKAQTMLNARTNILIDKLFSESQHDLDNNGNT